MFIFSKQNSLLSENNKSPCLGRFKDTDNVSVKIKSIIPEYDQSTSSQTINDMSYSLCHGEKQNANN